MDLPGLIHSETKQQSASDVELVQDVVQAYMKEPRSIILAVVSTKNDYANQIVLKLARAADKRGNRTLGVITKPDTLIPGSESEAMYISLARNQDVEFRLGWHVLRNMDSETGVWSLADRDVKEEEFFLEQSSPWEAITRRHLEKVWKAAKEFLSLTTTYIADAATSKALFQKIFEPALNQLLGTLNAKSTELLTPH